MRRHDRETGLESTLWKCRDLHACREARWDRVVHTISDFNLHRGISLCDVLHTAHDLGHGIGDATVAESDGLDGDRLVAIDRYK